MVPNIDWIGSLVCLETDPYGTASKHLSLRGIGRQLVSHLTATDVLQNEALKLDTNK
jgi:hypothetical protein